MLRDKNNDKLQGRGIENQFFLFYQLWLELVNVKTLDTYQYKVLYSIKAMDELVEVIENRLNGFYLTNHNIKACREETLEIVKNDLILKKYYSHQYNVLLSCLGKSYEKSNEQKFLKHKILSLKNTMSKDYFAYLSNDLLDAIKNQEKYKIVCLTNILVSYCIDMGWSPKALNDKVQIFKEDGTIEEKWRWFIESLGKNQQSQYCILINLFLKASSMSIEQVSQIIYSLGVKIISYDDVVLQYPYVSDKLKKKNYMVVNVTAYDIFSATMQSLNSISEALNMLSFYNMIDGWNIKDIKFIAIDLEKQYSKLILPSDLYGTYDYLDSSSKIFECTKRIFSLQNNEKLQNKLRGVFGYANISKNSLFQEEKYMNIWVALESLARTDLYTDIITNVLENVPSALCIRYIYRLVRNFCEDLLRCEVTLEELNIDLLQEEKEELVTNVINVFRGDDYEILKEKCRVNELLEYRCDEIQKILVDGKVTWEKITMHHKRIDWQLQRLYRIRNEIAHSALQERTSLLIYIEHLFDYLATFVSEIVTRVDENGIENIEQVFMNIQDNYNEFDSICSKAKGKVDSAEVLPKGIIDLI